MSFFTILEIIATISGIVCVFLQTKEKIAAWPFGIVSVTISAYIFYHSRLYSDLGLHVIYIFLNIYGWYFWSVHKRKEAPTPILRLSVQQLVLYGGLTAILAVLLGYLMGTYTDADLYYFDAFTTAGSLVAQYLLAKKYIHNWLFWIAVDLVAIPVYLYKGLYFFSGLFFVYLVICIYGYLNWSKVLRAERAVNE